MNREEIQTKMKSIREELDNITVAEDDKLLVRLLLATTRNKSVKEMVLANNEDSSHVPLITDDINSLKETINDYRRELGLALI